MEELLPSGILYCDSSTLSCQNTLGSSCSQLRKISQHTLFRGQQIPEWLRSGCAMWCAFFSNTMTFEFLDHHLYDWWKEGDREPVLLYHLLLPVSIAIWAMPWESVQLACCCSCLKKRWTSQQKALSNRWPMCSMQTCLKRLIEEKTEQRGNWAYRHENSIDIPFTKQHPITVQ